MNALRKLFPLQVPVANSTTDWRIPETACALLDDLEGMKTRGYKNYEGSDAYGCSSPYKELGPGTVFSISNNLAYYVTGHQHTAKELKLVLNVNSQSTAQLGHQALAYASLELTKRALNAELLDEVVAALLAGQPGKWKAGKSRIEVIREDWPTGKGYEVKFIIR